MSTYWHKTSLDFVNISESVIFGRLFLSYNGPGRGHLCHTDTFLVPIYNEVFSGEQEKESIIRVRMG